MAGDEPQQDDAEEVSHLLEELRVALPGVQILFAFLLTIPFANRFRDVTDLQKDLYFVSLLLTLAAVTFLIAPSSYHRIRFRELDPQTFIRAATRLAITGTVFLAGALSVVTFFITDFLFDASLAGITTGGLVGALAWFWFGLPLSRRLQD